MASHDSAFFFLKFVASASYVPVSFVPSMDVIFTRPHRTSTTSSPALRVATSSPSSRIFRDTRTGRSPSEGSFGTRGAMIAWTPSSSYCGTLVSSSSHIPCFSIAINLKACGSYAALLMAQKLSHSKLTTFLDAPWPMMNSCSDSTDTPRRTTPWIVGNRGSSQPSTAFWSTSHASFRFDMSVRTKLIRANAWIFTGRSFNAFWIHAYCASRSLYSVVRSACVTPSNESTTGHAKSYVGYAWYFIPVRWCSSLFPRNMTGSRSVPLSDVMSIFARRHQSSAFPAQSSLNLARFTSAAASRCLLFVRVSRSAFIVSWGVSSMNAWPALIIFCATFIRWSKWSDVCDIVT
mmetsp:Transcript_8825/g.27589  ORF Transcript_8825/g.27589 Transcript_8825/m.27589 type:complete len:348 (+) Transcript_8825:395-1438(+)